MTSYLHVEEEAGNYQHAEMYRISVVDSPHLLLRTYTKNLMLGSVRNFSLLLLLFPHISPISLEPVVTDAAHVGILLLVGCWWASCNGKCRNFGLVV